MDLASEWKEFVRIGGVDVSEAAAFTREPILIVDEVGRIYARVRAEGEVRVFTKTGAFEFTVGGIGDGPGELRTASGHGLVGDTLWVRDWVSRRISRFSRDGTLLGTEPTDRRVLAPDGPPQGQTVPLVGGRALSIAQELPWGVQERLWTPVALTTRELEGPVVIGEVPLPGGMFISGVGSFQYQPIPMPSLIAVSPVGTEVVVAGWRADAPGELTLRRFASDGTETLSRQFALTSHEVPEDVVEEIVERGRELAERGFMATERAGGVVPGDPDRAVRDGLYLPAFFPPIQQVVLGADGTIWLRQMTGVDRGDWLVLDGQGRELFQIRHPGIHVQQVSREAVWGTVAGAFDVPIIVGLEVVGHE